MANLDLTFLLKSLIDNSNSDSGLLLACEQATHKLLFAKSKVEPDAVSHKKLRVDSIVTCADFSDLVLGVNELEKIIDSTVPDSEKLGDLSVIL